MEVSVWMFAQNTESWIFGGHMQTVCTRLSFLLHGAWVQGQIRVHVLPVQNSSPVPSTVFMQQFWVGIKPDQPHQQIGSNPMKCIRLKEHSLSSMANRVSIASPALIFTEGLATRDYTTELLLP